VSRRDIEFIFDLWSSLQCGSKAYRRPPLEEFGHWEYFLFFIFFLPGVHMGPFNMDLASLTSVGMEGGFSRYMCEVK
jgi:hypothetical protein